MGKNKKVQKIQKIQKKNAKLNFFKIKFNLERVNYWQKLGFLKNFSKNTYVKFHAFDNILAKFQLKFNLKHSFY